MKPSRLSPMVARTFNRLTPVRVRAPRPYAAPASGHGVDPVIYALLVVGFFVGPMKMLGNPWVAYALPDALALLALAICVQPAMHRGEQMFPASPLTAPILLLATYCVLQLANPDAPLLRSMLGLRSWLLYLGMYFVGFRAFRSISQLRRLYALLIGLGVVTALFGVWQWYVGPEAFAHWSPYYQRWGAMLAWTMEDETRVFRAFSTFVMPGVFAESMVLVMSLAVCVALSSSTSRLYRAICALACLPMALGIAASGSRGPVVHLALMGGLALALVPGLWARLSAGLKILIIGAVVFTLIPEMALGQTAARFGTLTDPWPMITRTWTLIVSSVRQTFVNPAGSGLGYTAGIPAFIDDPLFRNMPTANTDSGYASAAVELGLPGFVLFVYVAAKIGLEGARAWRSLPASALKDLMLGPGLWAVTFPVITFIAQPQAGLPHSIYFWLLIGMLMKASSVATASQAQTHHLPVSSALRRVPIQRSPVLARSRLARPSHLRAIRLSKAKNLG